MRKRKLAFTLVEVIASLLILGTLVGFAVPRYMESQKTARANTFVANVREIKSALEAYRASSGVGEQLQYPTSLTELQDFTKDPVNPYTSQTMLSDNPLDSGIIYSSDGLTYSLCVIQRDADDINKNDIVDEPLPMFAEEACDSQAIPVAGGRSIMLVANPASAGSPSVAPSNVSVGDTVTLSANPKLCYSFTGWSSSDVTVSNNQFVMPDKNVTVVANYTATQYIITAISNNPLYGTVTGASTYDCGKRATLIAIPTTGAIFNGWYENNNQVSTNTAYTFTVNSDRTLEARFSAYALTITFDVNPADAGSPTATPNPAAPGDTVMLTANPSSCYNFSSWSAPAGVTINNNLFTMPAQNVTITANYVIKQYNVSVAPNNPSYGTVTGSGTYDCGSTATLTAVPNTGYTFVGWYEDGSQVSTATTYIFTVNGNRTLEARFSATAYTITVNKTPAAGGSPTATPNPAYVGQTVTLTANPDSCYNFSGWSSPDVTITGNSFVMPAKDVTVTASYTVRQYTVSAAPNNPSYGTVTGSGTYNCGSTATLTAVPNTGYTFVGWYDENGSQVSTATTYTFTVNDNRTLEARFEIESSYVSEFKDTFDSEASLSNWVPKINRPNMGPLPTLSIDNGTLKIDGMAEGFPYAQSAIAIKTPNPRYFVIEGDVKTEYPEIWLGFRSINGQQRLCFGFTFDNFCIQVNDKSTCTPARKFRQYGRWMHLKVKVNNNVITGYVGTTPVLTVNTNSEFMPGYVTAELHTIANNITGWFDNIMVYGY